MYGACRAGAETYADVPLRRRIVLFTLYALECGWMRDCRLCADVCLVVCLRNAELKHV